jgi:hypothetical protein
MLPTAHHIAHWDLVDMSKLWMAEQEVGVTGVLTVPNSRQRLFRIALNPACQLPQ